MAALISSWQRRIKEKAKDLPMGSRRFAVAWGSSTSLGAMDARSSSAAGASNRPEG